MQRTADFHNQIVHARFPQAARIVDDVSALDAAVDVLDADPATRDPPIDRRRIAPSAQAHGTCARPRGAWAERQSRPPVALIGGPCRPAIGQHCFWSRNQGAEITPRL